MRFLRGMMAVGLAAVLMLTTTVAVFAQTADPEENLAARPRMVRGVVVSKEARSFEIKKPDGSTLIIAVNAQTKFRLPGTSDAGFKDLRKGDRVTVLGRAVQGGEPVARLVNIEPRRPKVVRLAGTVTHADNNRLTIDTLKGDSVTLTLNDKTRFIPADAKPKKGDKVAVVGAQAWGEEEIVARLVAVRKDQAANKS